MEVTFPYHRVAPLDIRDSLDFSRFEPKRMLDLLREPEGTPPLQEVARGSQ